MTRTRARLSREAVVDGALALVDAEGLEALTFRRLAADLGVTPMALYWHVADKDALHTALGERLFAGVDLPAPVPGWREDLAAVLQALATGLHAHPAVAPLALRTVLTSEPGLVVAERVLSRLCAAGLDDATAAHTGAQLLSSLVSLVVDMPGGGADDDEARTAKRQEKAALAALQPEGFPTVIALAAHLVDCDDEHAYLERGVRLLAGGVEQLVAAC